MSGPSLYLELPPSSLFKFPPDPAPPALPPYSSEPTFANPFNIPPETYNALLSPKVPLAIASAYALTVSVVNAYNRRNGNRAWGISKTGLFRAFVILHNVFLAVYSFVTCVAMVKALKSSLPRVSNEHDLVEAVDSLCKVHGPRGLGDAVYYNGTTSAWTVKNPLIHLTEFGTPDPTDVGRLWNEGLGFWGWWFYLSKFYEVLDTFVIQAKGKRSSTLQTYHHAGAMLCMWAGIRFMSPPIWMFVTINSGIHALMYTYYTLSALHIRVPQALKRTLTTMQITQFVVGATFAGLHLFISYSVPVSTPYTITKTLTAAASTATSAASSVASSASDVVSSAAATAGLGEMLKKIAYRAAGEEGLAENVAAAAIPAVSVPLVSPIVQAVKNAVEQVSHETAYRTQYHTVNCIDTTGQSFAIWLNLMYLFPLTALFVRFFIKSYIKRTSAAAPVSRSTLAKATKDAANGVDREIDSLGRGIEDTMETFTAKLKHVTDESEKERLKREVLKDLSNYKSQAKDKANAAQNGDTKRRFEREAEAAKKALEERVKQALADENVSTKNDTNGSV